MNKFIEKQIQLHLAEYPDQTPIDVLEYQDYTDTLRCLYHRRYLMTWLNLSLGLWFVSTYVIGVLGFWFMYLPLVTMVAAGGLFWVVTQDGE